MLRRLLRLIFGLVVVSILGMAVFAVLATETEPLVTQSAPPSPDEVVQARSFVHGLREAIDLQGGAGVAEFTTDTTEMNSLIKLGARVIPGFRGTMTVVDGEVLVEGSLPLDRLGLDRWINVSASVPPFRDRVALSRVRLGPFDLPPGLALEAIRLGGNLIVGQDFGDRVLGAASDMRIEGERLSFVMTMDQLGGNGIMRGVFGSLRGSDLPGPEDIARYHGLIRAAMDRGELPLEGSFLPYIRFTLNAALEGSRTEDPRDAYTSALFGLALACGASDFNTIVGGVTDKARTRATAGETDCGKLTLNGRIDSRRHFSTAAALQSASNRGFAVSVGEFKELHDTIRAGGFDLTDIAANNSGIRMSNLFMSVPPEAWPGLIDRIQTENDVIIPFDGIPQIMSGEDFKAIYGDVESPEYKAVLAMIEARIDDIALHR